RRSHAADRRRGRATGRPCRAKSNTVRRMTEGERTVAVTGIGLVTPAGDSVDAFWDTLLAGRSMARNVEHIDVSESPIRFGGECDFDPRPILSEKDMRRSDRNTQLAIVAAEHALTDAGDLDVDL